MMMSACELYVNRKYIDFGKDCDVCASGRKRIALSTIASIINNDFVDGDPVKNYVDDSESLKFRSDYVELSDRVSGVDNCRRLAIELMKNHFVFVAYRQFIKTESIYEADEILENVKERLWDGGFCDDGLLKLSVVEVDGEPHIEIAITTNWIMELDSRLNWFYWSLGMWKRDQIWRF